jgi:hypothetical protein
MIVAFDHRIRVLQDFANDGKLFTSAQSITRKLHQRDGGAPISRVCMRQSENYKRVLLMISETQDRGSGALREALLKHNITTSRSIRLTSTGRSPTVEDASAARRPCLREPDQCLGSADDAGTTEALTGYRGATRTWYLCLSDLHAGEEHICSNPAEVMTRYTGGREHQFLNGGGSATGDSGDWRGTAQPTRCQSRSRHTVRRWLARHPCAGHTVRNEAAAQGRLLVGGEFPKVEQAGEGACPVPRKTSTVNRSTGSWPQTRSACSGSTRWNPGPVP